MNATRIAALSCFASAGGAIIFMGISGARWPLAFTVTCIVGGVILGVGESLGGRR